MRLILTFLPLIIFGVFSQVIPNSYAALISLLIFGFTKDIRNLIKNNIFSWIIVFFLIIMILNQLILDSKIIKDNSWIFLSYIFLIITWGAILFKRPNLIKYSNEPITENKETISTAGIHYIISIAWGMIFLVDSVAFHFSDKNDIPFIISLILGILLTKKISDYK